MNELFQEKERQGRVALGAYLVCSFLLGRTGVDPREEVWAEQQFDLSAVCRRVLQAGTVVRVGKPSFQLTNFELRDAPQALEMVGLEPMRVHWFDQSIPVHAKNWTLYILRDVGQLVSERGWLRYSHSLPCILEDSSRLSLISRASRVLSPGGWLLFAVSAKTVNTEKLTLLHKMVSSLRQQGEVLPPEDTGEILEMVILSEAMGRHVTLQDEKSRQSWEEVGVRPRLVLNCVVERHPLRCASTFAWRCKLLTPAQADRVLQEQRCKRSQRPRLFDKDPNAMAVGAAPGDLVQVTRMTDTGRSREFYVVVDPQQVQQEVQQQLAAPPSQKERERKEEMDGLMDTLEQCVRDLNEEH